MIAIRAEISEVESGKLDAVDNPLKNAPHTASVVTADDWTHPYSRQTAAFHYLMSRPINSGHQLAGLMILMVTGHWFVPAPQ